MKIRIIAIMFFAFFIFCPNLTSTISEEQKLNDTAKIAEILLNWSPGKLSPAESLQGTIVKSDKKIRQKLIPFVLLVYRNSNTRWKIKLNEKTFEQWQDFLIKQKGEWPEEGIITIITDEELPINIPLDVPAFTHSFGVPKEKLTITAISITRIQKQKLRPANFPNKILFEAIVATEICNTMFIALHGEERDHLCVSLGIAVGAIRTGLNYEQYQKKISKVKILYGTAPIIFPKYDYLRFDALFREGPIIELSFK